jgi:hypothetical protein
MVLQISEKLNKLQHTIYFQGYILQLKKIKTINKYKRMKTTSIKLMLATVCVLLLSALMNQINAQQKAWSGNNNGFGIDSLNNPSTVSWTLTQGAGTGVSTNAVGGGERC